MATYMGKDAVGTVFYQRDPHQPQSLEIRNISMSANARGRDDGVSLLRNTETKAAQNNFSGIEEYVVHTKASKEEMIAFLESQGYSIQDITDMYALAAGLDVVMSKPVNE